MESMDGRFKLGELQTEFWEKVLLDGLVMQVLHDDWQSSLGNKNIFGGGG